jgi:hypothetical protein
MTAAMGHASTRGWPDMSGVMNRKLLEVWMQSQSLRWILIIPVLLCLPLSGCFSAYRLSETQRGVLASLTREQALDIVRRSIARSDEQGGFCHEIYKNSFGRDSNFGVNPALATLDGTIVRYKTKDEIFGAGHTQVSGTMIGGVGTVTIASLVVDLQLTADLTQLQQIWVEGEGYVCAFKKYPGRQVTLVVTRDGLHQQWLSFGLAPGRFDEFLAAVRYLSPNAEVRGHGI